MKNISSLLPSPDPGIARWFVLAGIVLCSWAPLFSQSCIGTQGDIRWRLYEQVPGWDHRPLNIRPNFPQSPTWTEQLTNLTTRTRYPSGYSNEYGSLVSGFLRAPEDGDYRFNVTADDRTSFYLSTDSLREHAVLVAEVPGWTGHSEHDKYPEQTSASIPLKAGKYYYFKLVHKEGGGGDFIQVFWEKPYNGNPFSWEIVPDSSVFGDDCFPLCEPAGRPCDDGDPLTSDDRTDGMCHCIGIPDSLPYPCIGPRGGLTALYYDSISGWSVNNLLADPDFPDHPDRSDFLPDFSGPVTPDFELYGTRVRGWLRPPVTGYYRFNVTGDNEVKLRLKDGPDPGSADEIATNGGYAYIYEHDDTPGQTSDSLYLEADRFYAVELLHKQNTYSSFFYVFWKTPLAYDTLWHLVDGSFLYQFDLGCESACLPAGTPCDDGLSNTFADAFDSTCTCVGIPCVDPACTNALDYAPYEACEAQTERHSTNQDNSWLSCEPSPSPNPDRGISHWILYDLGAIHALSDAKVWNYNGFNGAGQGFETVAVDYSLDGIHWSVAGVYQWNAATGDASYSGFDFSGLNGLSARFLLFTALSTFNPGTGCAGLSEIRIDAFTCPPAGTPCDDGDPNTENDAYNDYCTCMGNFSLPNDCAELDLLVESVPVPSGKYTAVHTVSGTGILRAGGHVAFIAGEEVSLTDGFEVQFGAEFLADVVPCETSRPVRRKKRQRSLLR